MKTINPSIFKAYDIRGIYPTDISEDNVDQITKAIYTYFTETLSKSPLTIVLSRDMRLSSPAIHHVIKTTLLQLGAHIIDIGLAPTTTFYFAVFHLQADCGIQISASHNPKEHNGLKLVKRVGNKIMKIGKGMGMETIKEYALSGKTITNIQNGTAIENNDMIVEDIKDAIKQVNPQHIKKLKIVADAGNAMGSLYLQELFKQIEGDLIPINFELDGSFPAHQPDPLQFKLFKQLQQKVLDEHADLGIMPDGDGDRIFFVDEKGKIIPATLITALVANELLHDNPGEKVLVDIRYIRNVKTVVEKLGGSVSISRVGHALITDQLNKENGIFAGESSGHYYFRSTGGAESAIRVILYVLNVLCRENKPFSEILKDYLTSPESGETNFELPKGIEAKQITDSIIKDYKQGTLDTLDGIAVNFPDWRFSIRSSNTEPLMRLNIEGENEELVHSKVNEITQKIISFGAKIKE